MNGEGRLGRLLGLVLPLTLGGILWMEALAGGTAVGSKKITWNHGFGMVVEVF